MVGDGELPHDVDSEAQVLGSMFRDETYPPPPPLLPESRDFYSPNYRGVYNAMLSLSEKSVPIGVLQLIEEGADQGTVLRLEDLTPTATACMHFTQKVKDVAYQREVYRYGYHLVQVSKMNGSVSQPMEDITDAVGRGYENILNKSTGKGDDVYTGVGSQTFGTQSRIKGVTPEYTAYAPSSLYSIRLSRDSKQSISLPQQLVLEKLRLLYNGRTISGSNKTYRHFILITKWKPMNSPKDC